MSEQEEKPSTPQQTPSDQEQDQDQEQEQDRWQVQEQDQEPPLTRPLVFPTDWVLKRRGDKKVDIVTKLMKTRLKKGRHPTLNRRTRAKKHHFWGADSKDRRF